MKVLVEGTPRVEINKVENDNKLSCTYLDISSWILQMIISQMRYLEH